MDEDQKSTSKLNKKDLFVSLLLGIIVSAIYIVFSIFFLSDFKLSHIISGSLLLIVGISMLHTCTKIVEKNKRMYLCLTALSILIFAALIIPMRDYWVFVREFNILYWLIPSSFQYLGVLFLFLFIRQYNVWKI